jgi:serine/threonine-protein kinase
MRHAISWVALACICFLTPYLWTHAAAGSRFPGVSNRESTDNNGIPPEAFAAWEEGNALLGQDPHMGSSEHGAPQILLRAIERYEYAVSQAPSFATAWASLAEAYEYAYPYVGRDPAKDAQRAEFAARRAVASNDKLAIAHANLAMVLFYLRWNFAGAEAEYRRALRLDRRLPYAVAEYADLLRETGRFDQAELEVTKARAVLPALPVLASKQAEIELDRNRVEAAIVTAGSAVRLKRDYGRAYVVLGMAYENKGLLVDALEQYRAALRMDAQDRRALPAYGYLLARVGRRDEARSVLWQLISMNEQVRNCAFQVAVVYTGLGEHDRALDWLERAYSTRQMHVPFLGVEPRLKPLRSSSRFRALLSRVGISG